jgi:hypothetical protein
VSTGFLSTPPRSTIRLFIGGWVAGLDVGGKRGVNYEYR